MKIKISALVLIALASTGCASTTDKAVRNFLDGASSNAKSRQQDNSFGSYVKKRDYKDDAIEDSVAGILTAIFRGVFASEEETNN